MAMGDLPSQAEFELLLQEQDVLRDYFNAFLNLPVFAKRLTYCAENCKFVIEPRVKSKSHSPHERGVWSWLVNSRLPLFWGSDLHLEYRLLQQLIAANPAVAIDVCSVAMMDDFRRFLYQTEGVCLWLFWKDVERLKLTKNKKLSSKVFHHIQITYLQDGSLLTLPKCVKERAVLVYHPKAERALNRMELLNAAQELALSELVHYWSLRYNIHSNENTTSIFQTFSRELGCESACSDNQTFLPSVIFDRGSIRDDKRPKKVSHIHLSRLSLPSLVPPEEKEEIKVDKMTPEPLISPSTHSLFPSRSDYSRQCYSLLQELPLIPYLYAFLRADSLSGRPFLHYLTKHAPNAVSCLLFWQSVEILVAQDEIKRLCSTSDEQLWDQLVFFEEYPVARDLRSLVGLFLSGRAPHKVDLPPRVKRRELCALVTMGLGHSTLLIAQEHSATMLLDHWQDYLVYDHQLFMNACLAKKYRRHNILDSLCVEQPPLPGELLSAVFHPPSLQAAWRALSYAEAAKYSGIHVLPSRCPLPTPVLIAPTDPEEYLMDILDAESLHSLKGVELNPMITIICDSLMYDWEESKIKRTLQFTTTTLDQAEKKHIPSTMSELLKNKHQLDVFKNYLFKRNTTAETPLEFLKAMDEAKSAADKETKLQHIQEKFLRNNDTEQGSSHPILRELAQYDQPSLIQLEEAQNQLMQSMEKCFFEDYVSHLKGKNKRKKSAKNKSEQDAADAEKDEKAAKKCNTKVLWRIFTDSVISFRRGLMDADTAQQFRNFLKNEVKKGHTKKVIGSKLVNFTKLLNDLSFWTEVEKYKDLVDSLKDNGRKHTPEDDIMIHKKALAIVNCFLDSNVTPRVQVNIPSDLASSVLNRLSKGRVTRGLFHKASLSLFPILITMWKRFCAHRFSEVKGKTTVRERPARAASTLLTQFDQQRLFLDGGPILSFSLALGIKWYYPPNYHMMLNEFRAQLAIAAAIPCGTVAAVTEDTQQY